MMYQRYGMGGGGWFLMTLIALALVALVVLAILAATRAMPRGRDRAVPAEPAEQVLADRLARGEIDSEEYEQRLRALRGSRQ